MKSKINILQISVRADIGGGPEHLYNLVKCSSDNFNHFIAVPNDEPYFKIFNSLVGELNCIIIPHRKFRILPLLKLKKLINEKDISIIHSHGKGAGIYGRLLSLLTGKKSIHTLHGFHIGEYHSIQKYLYIILEKILSLFTSVIIAVSEGEKNLIFDAGICDVSKIKVIENGVEIPDKTITTINYDQEPKKIIHFSRFNYQKNTSLIIAICQILKTKGVIDKFQFDIYGDGEEFKVIKNEIIEKKLEKFIYLHGNDPAARTKLINGFCYISTSRWEGLPISLLEALSVGLPVLATNTVGNNNIVVHNENGFLFEIEDVESAANYLIELSGNKQVWINFSTNAKKYIAEKFSLKKMIQQIERIYTN